MIQGRGEVVYASKIPVSGESAIEDSILSVVSGVVFSTSLGVFIIRGKDVQELTELLT